MIPILFSNDSNSIFFPKFCVPAGGEGASEGPDDPSL